MRKRVAVYFNTDNPRDKVALELLDGVYNGSDFIKTLLFERATGVTTPVAAPVAIETKEVIRPDNIKEECNDEANKSFMDI